MMKTVLVIMAIRSLQMNKNGLIGILTALGTTAIIVRTNMGSHSFLLHVQIVMEMALQTQSMTSLLILMNGLMMMEMVMVTTHSVQVQMCSLTILRNGRT